ncbi:putative ribonuclease H-like domain-containing protein, partial [Tanacetum coccineum]
KGPNWLFDFDYLTDLVNYQPVTVENKANKCTQDNIDAENSEMETEPAQEYFVLPLWSSYTSTVKSSEAKNRDQKPNGDTGLKTNKEPKDQEAQAFLEELKRLKRQEKEANDTAEAFRKDTPISTANPLKVFSSDESDLTNNDHDDSQIPALEEIYDNLSDGIFTNSSYDDKGAVADFTNLETTMNVSPIPTSRIHSIHPTTQILGDPTSAVQTRRKVNKSSTAHAFKAIGTKWVYRNKKDERGVLCFEIRVLLYGTIDEEVYVSQPPGFIDPKFPKKVYKVGKAQYGLPPSTQAWFQVTSKTSHLHAVKRIFRYLKGKPKIGLWYPRVSSFDLEAYSDSDYAGKNLDRKSTTGGCQFLGMRLISWQCKKQKIVATSTIEAEYVDAANCLGQFWNTTSSQTVNDEKQIHATVDSKVVVVTEALIRSSLLLNDADGTACLTNEAIFQNLALMGYEGELNKLTFQKALFSPQWKYMIHTILHCLSSKSTSWNELDTSKLLFDGMLKNLDTFKKNFLMYPIFLTVFLNNQIELGEPFNDVCITPAHTLKVFSNMSRKGVKFSRKVTPLFDSMLVPHQAPEGDQPPVTDSSSSHDTTQDSRDSLEGTNGRKNAKLGPTLDESTFDDLDADHGMDYIDTEEPVNEGRLSKETKELNVTHDTKVLEKGGSNKEPVSAADNTGVSTAVPKVSTAGVSTAVPELKGMAIKEVKESNRPERSILTLKPLPSIDPKDKGKGVLKESPVKKVKRSDLDAAQIAKDAEVARLVYEEELVELEKEKEERQIKTSICGLHCKFV